MTNRTGQKRTRARPANPGKKAGAPTADAVVIPFSAPALNETPARPASPAAPAKGVLVKLEADCTARHADGLKSALLGQLDAADCVNLDVTAIERIDTVSLQLLTAFVRDRMQGGRPIGWTGHNDIFSQAARLLGLTAALSAGEVA